MWVPFPRRSFTLMSIQFTLPTSSICLFNVQFKNASQFLLTISKFQKTGHCRRHLDMKLYDTYLNHIRKIPSTYMNIFLNARRVF